jgi:hypothetical protein
LVQLLALMMDLRVEPEAGPKVAREMGSKVVQPALKAELGSEQARLPQAHSELLSPRSEPQEQPPQARLSQEPVCLQGGSQPEVLREQALKRGQPVSRPQALSCPLRALQQEPRASAAQPQVAQVPSPPALSQQVLQPDAFAPPSLPHPWRLYPPWPWLLPPLPRPLLPGDVSAPSPQHPRGWSSNASSFR